MPDARTPGKWPYRAAKPSRRRRVVKTREPEQHGVQRREKPAPRPFMTPMQARLIVLVAMLSAIVAGGWWAYHSPWLTVRTVTVNGAVTLTPEQVRSAAGLDGHSTFALDVDGARTRVAALPKVRSVSVTKHGWNAVSIDVEERVAWGSWQINGVNVPIDIDGTVLDGAAAPDGAPVIVEIEPQRVINTGDRLDPGAVQLAARLVRESNTAFGRTVLSLVYKQNSGLTAVLSGSETDDQALWVTFGDSRDYDYKIAALYVLIEQAAQSDLALHVVDLRFGDRLTFQ
jgi:cell division protein FtsQ